MHVAMSPCRNIIIYANYSIIDLILCYRSDISTTPFLHLRYEGTDCALMVTTCTLAEVGMGCQHGDFQASFTLRYVMWCVPFLTCLSLLSCDVCLYCFLALHAAVITCISISAYIHVCCTWHYHLTGISRSLDSLFLAVLSLWMT